MRDGLPEHGDIIANKFRVERLLGRGGMGSVYAVTHLVTGKLLALKCLLPQLSHDAAAVARFMREAQAVGKIQHRHVVDIFDVMEDDGLCFIVMPYLDGPTLTELLRDGHMTLEQALIILIRAMEGVAAAHAAGVVHRDLKPCNIVVCRGMEGRFDDPRVLDFGISRVLADGTERLTASGAALGTPSYMALEQLVGDPSTDARADIFAMGVILYEAFTGKLPHVAQNAAALALERQTNPPTDLSILRPDLPDALSRTIMRALATKRELRPSSMLELADALRPFVRQLSESKLETKLREGNQLAVTRMLGGAQVDEHAPTTPASAINLRTTSDTRDALVAAGLLESSRPSAAPARAARASAVLGLIALTATLLWLSIGGKDLTEADAAPRSSRNERQDAAVVGSTAAPVVEPTDAGRLESNTEIAAPPRSESKQLPRRRPTAAKVSSSVSPSDAPSVETAAPLLKPDAQAPLRAKSAPPTPDGLRPEDF